MQNLANIGQMQTSAGQAQQQYGLSAAQQAQAAQSQDYVRQMSALQNVNEMARQNQALRTADAAALESAGAAQQNISQRVFDAERAKAEEARLYPQRQLDWLSTQIRGIAPSVPTTQTSTGSTTGASYAPSPLSQLATGIYTAKALGSI
jgi:molecular chaperone DnaK (HSP70)